MTSHPPDPTAAAPSGGDRGAQERYRTADLIEFPLGGNRWLMHGQLTGGTAEVGLDLATLLDALDRPRTLDEHARDWSRRLAADEDRVESLLDELSRQLLSPRVAAIVNRVRAYRQARATPGGNPSAAALTRATAMVAELAAQRLLVGESELRRRCLDSPRVDDGPTPPVSTFGVITRERLPTLRRCLLSYIDNAQRHDRRLEVAVMDDAREPAVRREGREMLAALAGQTGAAIRYGGEEEKRAFARELAATSGVSLDVVEFGLFDVEGCGFSFGANRNALLLDTAGDLLLCADDDTVCRPGVASWMGPGLQLASTAAVYEHWFYPDRQSVLDAVSFADEDVVARHEAVLGQSLASVVHGTAGGDDLGVDDLGSTLLDDLRRGRGRVRFTQSGLAGDAGGGGPPFELRLSPSSLQRLTADPATYERLSRSRERIRGVPRLTVTSYDHVQTCPLVGFDNRTVLPPCFPVLRNCDGMFGLTLRTCITDAYIAHLPHLLVHDPDEERGRTPLEVAAAHPAHFELVVSCIRSTSAWPLVADGSARLRALGRHLAEIGSQPAGAFVEFLRTQLWHHKSGYLRILQRELESHRDRPGPWTDELAGFIERVRATVGRDDYLVPRELADRGPERALAVSQRLILGYGRLLMAWPDLVAAAARLRVEGRGLARRRGGTPATSLNTGWSRAARAG